MSSYENYDSIWDNPIEWTDTVKTTNSIETIDTYLVNHSSSVYLEDDIAISASLLLSSMTDSSGLLTSNPVSDELQKPYSSDNSITGTDSANLTHERLHLFDTKNKTKWNSQEINRLMKCSTNPIGKFLKTLNISISTIIDLNLMELLMNEAPIKKREKVSVNIVTIVLVVIIYIIYMLINNFYPHTFVLFVYFVYIQYGTRRLMTTNEKKLQEKQRNREHAHATRLRRKVFKKVSEIVQDYKDSLNEEQQL